MKKKPQKTFEITAKVTTIATAIVPAETFEQALEVSKTLNADDFLYSGKFRGAIQDQEVDIEMIGKRF